MDNVIADSSGAFIKAYSKMYGVQPLKETTNKWDFGDVFPNEVITQQMKTDIFSSKLYFDLLEPIKDSVEILRELSEKHKVYIVSISSPMSSKRKIDWCYDLFPFANFIPVISYDHNKSRINMSVPKELSFFIDDRIDCLDSSNADFKLLYKTGGDWQENYIGHKVNNWIVVKNFINGWVK